jgi:hypothetical protein
VNRQVIVRPERLTVAQIFCEENVEIRRIMIERLGLERLLTSRQARYIHRDRSWKRQLYRCDLNYEKPVVAVRVKCPSTGRIYFLRVPPATKTCVQAVAWGFGFTRADEYRTLVETYKQGGRPYSMRARCTMMLTLGIKCNQYMALAN